jgi:NADH-quinone oxidoreductase subunit N
MEILAEILTRHSTITALLILTIGSALALKYRPSGFIAGLIATAIVYENEPLLAFITAIALLNFVSLGIMSRIYGTTFTLPILMLLATIYAFHTNDIVTLIICFIVSSVPTYVLVLISDEFKPKTAVKYITFMVVATLLFVLGIVLIQIDYRVLGAVLMLTGLALEVGISPFHEWVPDVFSEADPIVVSIIASLTKFVPFLIAFKVMNVLGGETIPIVFVFAISIVSMFVGNIGALTSTEPKRILAYSTIANMGYVVSALAVVVNPSLMPIAFAGAFIQLLANSVGKIGFFTAVKNGSSRVLTYTLAFSMIGVPPLLGFWGKFFILTALVKANLLILAGIFVLNSVLSVPYYVRLAKLVGDIRGISVLTPYVVIACVILSLFIYPNPIYESCLRLWG